MTRPRIKIKKGDNVIVLAGRDKGKKGEVLGVFPRENRALVRDVNKVKRHQRPTTASPGGIIERESKIHISNLALVDSASGKASRAGFKVLEDGTKARIYKKSGEVVSSG